MSWHLLVFLVAMPAAGDMGVAQPRLVATGLDSYATEAACVAAGPAFLAAMPGQIYYLAPKPNQKHVYGCVQW